MRGALGISLIGAAFAAMSQPAAAQSGDRELLGKLRDCAKLDPLVARASCYDRYLRPAPGAAPPMLVAAPPPPAPPPERSFGREALRAPRAPAQEQVLSARVAEVAEREPGRYLITLEDGAQWQFANSVTFSYEPPERGATVEIRHAALGSFLLRYQGQASVRVVRVR